MVPLGTPDENGIYPTVEPTEDMKKPTTYLPEEYTSNVSDTAGALEEIAKYGSEYYAYDSGATYKGYLKVYVDFAREAGATPVLVTPVARTGFNSDGTLKDGPGRHGDDFAYVKAVRQLAEEEDVLLVDLFDYTKTVLETAGPSYADYLMALVPNDLTGTWPTDYDNIYGNAELGFEKIEGTHYNKYGAFITAAAVAQTIVECGASVTANGGKEYFNFASHVLAEPEQFVDPSNRMPISTVAKVEDVLDKVNVTNPDRVYKQADEVIAAIDALVAKGPVTAENYLALQPECEAVRSEYESLNFDIRKDVTNYDQLVEMEEAIAAQIEAARPKPVEVITLDASAAVGEVSSADGKTYVSGPVTMGDHVFSFSSGDMEIRTNYKSSPFDYGGNTYQATTQCIYIPGSSNLTSSARRYIEFTVEGPCTITVAAQSTNASQVRNVQLVGVASNTVLGTFEAAAGTTVTSVEVAEGGTYRLGSAGSGIAVYYVIIEYFE